MPNAEDGTGPLTTTTQNEEDVTKGPHKSGKSPSGRTRGGKTMTILEMHGYTMGHSVGHGSYATVKEAYSRKHKHKVAIKIISKSRAPQDYLERFLPRELEVIKLLKHPNIIINMQVRQVCVRLRSLYI